MAITKIDAATETFDGFARVILFPDVDPADFTDSTTLAQVLTGGKDLGQIVEDSPSWDGEDANVEVLRDTEGGVIRALPTPGTFAWSCRVASTSAACRWWAYSMPTTCSMRPTSEPRRGRFS